MVNDYDYDYRRGRYGGEYYEEPYYRGQGDYEEPYYEGYGGEPSSHSGMYARRGPRGYRRSDRIQAGWKR